MPLGLTEPLFVPEYSNPPSLFNLAQRTGVDIERLIFCFAIGGIAAVLYNVLTGLVPEPVDPADKNLPRHRQHFRGIDADGPARALGRGEGVTPVATTHVENILARLQVRQPEHERPFVGVDHPAERRF
jgi:hypothetical protein